MRFDLVDLRLFLHVAEARSITHGAERAHLALASASARIRGMEDVLGVPLLKRDRRGVTLTAAGESLLDHARVVLQSVERLQGDLGAFARGLRGSIHVLSNTSAASEHLPKVLASFLADHPTINIDLDERESPDIVEAIAAGRADVGIATEASLSDAVTRYPFRDDRLVLVVPRSDSLASRRDIRLQDVLDRDFVGHARGSALQAHIASQAARLGATLKLRIRANSFDSLCRMIETRVGIGIVPETSAKRCRRSMALAVLRLRDPWATRKLAICVHRHNRLSVPAQRLVEHLRRSAAS